MKYLVIIILSLTSCYTSKKEDFSSILYLLTNSTQSVLILGDSLSERSNSFGLKEKLGSSYTITDISVSGRDIPIWLNDTGTILANKSNIIIVNLGTNDASYSGVSTYPENYRNLIQFLESSHNWLIILSQVPPTNDGILQSRIAINNQWIKNTYPDKVLVDLETIFYQNWSLPLYPTTDPIHPNPIGYELIGEAYRTALLRLPFKN
jgi:lysophospholipase L1-like esterase